MHILWGSLPEMSSAYCSQLLEMLWQGVYGPYQLRLQPWVQYAQYRLDTTHLLPACCVIAGLDDMVAAALILWVRQSGRVIMLHLLTSAFCRVSRFLL